MSRRPAELALRLWTPRSAFVLFALFAAAAAGKAAVAVHAQAAQFPVWVIPAAAILTIAILMRPFVGLVAIMMAFQVAGALQVTGASLLNVLGLMTLAGYFLHGASRIGNRRLTIGQAFAGIFVLWIFVSAPGAALAGGFSAWGWVYLRLWLLVWLTCALANTPQRHRALMVGYVIAAVVSALVSITQAHALSGADVRVAGLTSGINSAARTTALGMVLAAGLSFAYRRTALGLAAVVGFVALCLAAVYTGSRTGLVLVVVGITFVVARKHWGGRGGKVLIVMLVALVAVSFLPSAIGDVLTRTETKVAAGTDTAQLRLHLWQAGVRMWEDHPIAGVGIGKFTDNLPTYGVGVLEPRRFDLGPHNVYVALLAETGIVGLLLMLCALLAALATAWRRSRADDPDSWIAYAWFSCMVLLMIGGLTKHDQYDVLFWMAIGLCLSMRDMHEEPAAADEGMGGSALGGRAEPLPLR